LASVGALKNSSIGTGVKHSTNMMSAKNAMSLRRVSSAVPSS
jgi:hypothetical protein